MSKTHPRSACIATENNKFSSTAGRESLQRFAACCGWKLRFSPLGMQSVWFFFALFWSGSLMKWKHHPVYLGSPAVLALHFYILRLLVFSFPCNTHVIDSSGNSFCKLFRPACALACIVGRELAVGAMHRLHAGRTSDAPRLRDDWWAAVFLFCGKWII